MYKSFRQHQSVAISDQVAHKPERPYVTSPSASLRMHSASKMVWKPVGEEKRATSSSSAAACCSAAAISCASKMGKPGSIQVLRDVGVLEAGGEKRATSSSSAAACSSTAAGTRLSRDVQRWRAIRKTNLAMIPDLATIAESEGPCRRWVHVHREAKPWLGVAFHVHRESLVCALLPKIGEWYGLNVSEFSLHESKSERRLASDMPWKDVALWDIEVEMVKNGEEEAAMHERHRLRLEREVTSRTQYQ
jgi:hypothetical protein